MKQLENAVLAEVISAFVSHKFVFLDGRRMNKEGIEATLKQYEPTTSSGVFWRSNTGALRMGLRYVQFGVSGCPDLIGFTNKGTFIGCEVKAGSNVLSPVQVAMQTAMQESRAIIFVARSWDDADSHLRFYGF